MTDVTFSALFNTIGSEEYRYAMRAVEDSNIRLSVLVQAPEVAFRRLDKRIFPDAIVARNKFVKFIKKILNDRLKAFEPESKDIFSFLLQAKDPVTGNGLIMGELSTETATLIVAGK